MSAELVSRRQAIGLTLAGAAGLAAPASAQGRDKARSIDRLAGEAIRTGETPGLQIAIQQQGRPILLRNHGLANLELASPVRDDMAFRIASVTKQFTSAALLRLQEEGKLSLDDRLAKYYPQFPRAAEVTLARMANHTSGIHNYLERPDWLADVMIRRDADASAVFFATMPTVYDFAPGTGWNYSNSAYIMLGGVIEKASGQTLADLFRTRFFDPLGMTHPAVDDERTIVAGRASGYERIESDGFRNAGYLSVPATGAAGSLRSTAADLVKWAQGLFGGKILNAQSLQAMLAPARLSNGDFAPNSPTEKASARSGYGYGLRISQAKGRLKLSHSGGIHGFTSFFSHFPDEKLTIVCLANCQSTNKCLSALDKAIEAIMLDEA